MTPVGIHQAALKTVFATPVVVFSLLGLRPAVLAQAIDDKAGRQLACITPVSVHHAELKVIAATPAVVLPSLGW
jgi:hypothetical protein